MCDLCDSNVINITSNKRICNIDKNIKKLKINGDNKNNSNNIIISIEKSNVEFLIINNLTNVEIKKLPISLKILHFDKNYNSPTYIFPPNLLELKINADIYVLSKKYIPNSLQKLELFGLPKMIIDFPPNLEVLFFGENKSNELSDIKRLLDNLPNKLKTLKIPQNWNYPIENLPNGLTKLIITDGFNQKLNFLPESLKYLGFDTYNYFDSYYSHELNNLPRGLEYLNLGFKNIEFPIETIPDTIKYLTILSSNVKINKLPRCLEILYIRDDVEFELIENISSNKNKYEFKNKYFKLTSIQNCRVPDSLNQIIFYLHGIDKLRCKFNKTKNSNVWTGDYFPQ